MTSAATNRADSLVAPMRTLATTPPCKFGAEAIFDIAERVGRRHGFDGGHKHDVHDLARSLGGSIRYVEFAVGVDAESLTVFDDTEFEIRLHDYTSPARDTFTVGHELGHLFLHYLLPKADGRPVQTPARFNRFGNDLAEVEANWFSSALLMPQKAFVATWKKHPGNLRAVATHFGVSRAAAEVRAKLLNLTAD